ncbi:MAG: cyclic nucleotide-binding domain-containing protein [Nitrospirae bacterium]|nr:cyclic nucleotide-binding domain-containing protein [Nitrospirota bacterium]
MAVPTKLINKDTVIFREGAKGDAAYLIKSGKVEITKTVDGKKLLLETLGPGSLFGEMALITQQDRSASAITLEPTEILILDLDGFTSLLNQAPKILSILIRSLVTRLRKTVDQVSAQVSDNPFLSVAVILDLLAKSQGGGAAAGGGGEKGGAGGKDGGVVAKSVTFPFRDVLTRIREALSLTGADVENILKKMAGVRQIVITAPSKTTDRMLTITDIANFLENVRGIAKEMDSSVTQGFKQEQELIDISTFSQLVGTKSDNVYKKIAAKEVPENIFFFRRSEAIGWATEKGKDFFEKTSRRAKKIEELEGINDVIFVDNTTLRQILGQTDVINLCKVIKHAEEDAQKKIYANLSDRMAQMVKEQMGQVEDADEIEVAEIEENIIGQIKAMKKASAGGAAPAPVA